MYLIRFLANLAVFCMFLWISQIDLNFAALHPREISEALILNELCHLHYTNCRLKICIWQLYFYSWLSKVYLKIFLISSPEHALTIPCPWQMTQSAFCLCSYILIGNCACQKLRNSPGVGKCLAPGQQKSLQMPHPWDWKGGQMPLSSPYHGTKKALLLPSFSKVARYCNFESLDHWLKYPGKIS